MERSKSPPLSSGYHEHKGADVQSVAFQQGVAVVFNRGQVYVIDRTKDWGLGAPPPRPSRACDYAMVLAGEHLPKAAPVPMARVPRGKRKLRG